LSMWTSQPSRLSQPTPANTSKITGRVFRAYGSIPALFLILKRCFMRHFQQEGALC
jgi:hypothetical protein